MSSVFLNNIPGKGLHLDHKNDMEAACQTETLANRFKIYGNGMVNGEDHKLSLDSKLLLYKCIMKPIRTYGIQLWGCTEQSHTKNHTENPIYNL